MTSFLNPYLSNVSLNDNYYFRFAETSLYIIVRKCICRYFDINIQSEKVIPSVFPVSPSSLKTCLKLRRFVTGMKSLISIIIYYNLADALDIFYSS